VGCAPLPQKSSWDEYAERNPFEGWVADNPGPVLEGLGEFVTGVPGAGEKIHMIGEAMKNGGSLVDLIDGAKEHKAEYMDLMNRAAAALGYVYQLPLNNPASRKVDQGIRLLKDHLK